MWEERLHAYLPENHPLLERDALTWSDLSGERLLIPQCKEGPLLHPCLAERISRHGPRIELCSAAQLTVAMKVMLGNGFSVVGEATTKITVPGIVWRPLTGDNATVPIKAIWLESNPKPALHHLVQAARNLRDARRGRDVGKAVGYGLLPSGSN